jgi:MtfA peptidase
MPPDTSHIPGVTGPPPPAESLIDSAWISMQQHLDSLEMSYLKSQESERPQFLLPEWEMFFIVMVIVYLFVLRPFLKERRQAKTTIFRHERKTEDGDQQYDHWLNRYNPYYASLSATQKKRFLHRVKQFMGSKQFHFHAMVEEEYMPVLISGAAVQLTFGLRNYLMDYFDVIHVLRREYILNIDEETYYGHVSKNGIHVSWNHFLGGYTDYADSVNLGLHEMAHALQYDTALGYEDTHDRNFKERLNDFSEEGRPVFRAMRQGASHLLGDYAATNFDEFWAVSVETFFENPQEFKEKLPNLYREMSELLNQDPLQPDKVLQWEIS